MSLKAKQDDKNKMEQNDKRICKKDKITKYINKNVWHHQWLHQCFGHNLDKIRRDSILGNRII